jgi:hypothetical protein
VDVAAWLSLTPDSADTALLDQVAAAVTEWVSHVPLVQWAPADPDTGVVTWPLDATQGATMLAARMYTRRNSPGGTQSMSDLVVYLPSRDVDVDQLLRLGGYGRVQVG